MAVGTRWEKVGQEVIFRLWNFGILGFRGRIRSRVDIL